MIYSKRLLSRSKSLSPNPFCCHPHSHSLLSQNESKTYYGHANRFHLSSKSSHQHNLRTKAKNLFLPSSLKNIHVLSPHHLSPQVHNQTSNLQLGACKLSNQMAATNDVPKVTQRFNNSKNVRGVSQQHAIDLTVSSARLVCPQV